ncbi:MAG: tRNA (N(6)-L-threonylcarbamoyladenosine(37)-C(2))-methylthiotransferase MtaB [Pseudobdellovibrionaceae bacterium]
MNFQVHTFGCKVNTYDSGLIQKNLRGSSLQLDPQVKIHVLNTCAVTAEATKEAVRSIRRIKAKDPLATVVVTGCAAQVDTDSFRNLPGADLVVANSHKGLLPQILDQYFKGEIKEKVFKSNIFRKDDLEMGGGEELSHTRSFLKIQDGCNSFCTYCIIPYARGKSRSIPISELVKRIQDLQVKGVNEVVLTGVHIGDYDDQGKALEDLLEALLLKTKMPRFRLSSLEPVELSDRLIELYQDERLCPHFHMSIQSAETETLKQMKRKYSQENVREALEKIQRKLPVAFVGMDVITGFPTETEAQFEETFATLAELPWTRIHVFPYSERPGTRAASLEVSIPWNDRLKRAQKLRELSLHRYQSEALRQKGSLKKVLLLKKETRGGAQGLSRDYWNIRMTNLDGQMPDSSGELLVKVTGYEHNPQHMEGVLLAEVVS